MNGLGRRWERLGLAADVGRDLLARYRAPGRRYHTVEHLEEVLDAVDALSDLAADPVVVELAAWFHDAVYDPTAAAGANAAASAVLARRCLAEPLAGRVAPLIELTATHRCDIADRDGVVLLDADLWILGSPPERYARYRRDVRGEYAHVPDADWRRGRSALLRGWLGRDRIFMTERFRARFDDRARRNLRDELSSLGGGEAET